MTPAQIGFFRGLGYVVLFGIVNYVSLHLGESGFLSAGTSTVITGILGALEHFLTDPSVPISAQ
jgi:hypothetical protein